VSSVTFFGLLMLDDFLL